MSRRPSVSSGLGGVSDQLASLHSTVITYRDREAQEVKSLDDRLRAFEKTVQELSGMVGRQGAHLEEQTRRIDLVGGEQADVRNDTADGLRRHQEALQALQAMLEARLGEIVRSQSKQVDWSTHNAKVVAELKQSLQGLSAFAASAERRFDEVSRRQSKQLDWSIGTAGAVTELVANTQRRFDEIDRRQSKQFEWATATAGSIANLAETTLSNSIELQDTLKKRLDDISSKQSKQLDWIVGSSEILKELRGVCFSSTTSLLAGLKTRIAEEQQGARARDVQLAERLDVLRSFLAKRIDEERLEARAREVQLTARLELLQQTTAKASGVGGERDQRLSDQATAQRRLDELTALISRDREQLERRDQKQLDWVTATARILAEIRQKDLAHLLGKLDAFEGALAENALAGAVRSAQQQRLHAQVSRETVHVLQDIRVLLADLAGHVTSSDSSPGIGSRLLALGAPQDGRQEGGSPDDRSFALRSSSMDPELEGLLSLGQFLDDDLQLAAQLSAITGKALRTLFPRGQTQIITIQCASGLDLDVDAGDIFGASAAFGRIQEANDFATFMDLVEPGAVVVDVGANFGLYAAHAALYAGAQGKVFAFEPEPDTYGLLAQNIRQNGLEAQSTCVQAALTARNGTAAFHVAADSAFSGLRNTGRSPIQRTVDVRTIRLDAFPPLKAVTAIDLIKVDVEGGEGAVLAGAFGLLERSPEALVMFEFSHKNLDPARLLRLQDAIKRLEALDFHVFATTKGGAALMRVAADDLAEARNENLFLCRPSSARFARLTEIVGLRQAPRPNPEQAAALALLRLRASPGHAAGPG